MALINRMCPDCGGSVQIGFGSSCRGGELIWSASHQCKDCDYALEEDSWGHIPDDYRQLELEHDGTWSLLVKSTETSRVRVVKVLREHQQF